jgi:hypothetical protein
MGDEQFCFVEGCQRSWDELSAPDGPLTVGIDGGYVRRQHEQGHFLSDGGEDVRNVQLYLNPQAEDLLDWFHLTMRLTVLNQTAKGLTESVGEGEDQYELRPNVLKNLERIKWYLWNGNVFQALNEL